MRWYKIRWSCITVTDPEDTKTIEPALNLFHLWPSDIDPGPYSNYIGGLWFSFCYVYRVHATVNLSLIYMILPGQPRNLLGRKRSLRCSHSRQIPNKSYGGGCHSPCKAGDSVRDTRWPSAGSTMGHPLFSECSVIVSCLLLVFSWNRTVCLNLSVRDPRTEKIEKLYWPWTHNI